MSISEDQQINSIIFEGNKIINKCKVSKDIQNYLNYQLFTLQGKSSFLPCCSSRYSGLKQQVMEEFRRGYSTLTKKQKALFYLLNAKILEKCEYFDTEQSNLQNIKSREVQKLRFSIIDNKIFKRKTEITALVQEKQKRLKVQNTNQIIDLHKFIIRTSKNKKEKFSLVLQTIQPYISSLTIRLYFTEQNFEQSCIIIKKIWEEAQFQNIYDLFQKKTKRQSKKSDNRNRTINTEIIHEEKNQSGSAKYQKQIRRRENVRQINIKKVSNNQLSIDSRDFDQSQLSAIDDSQQFFTVQGSLQTQNFQIIQGLQGINILQQDQELKPEHRYLRHRYQIGPNIKGAPRLFRQPEGHIVFGKDWRICDNGNFVFINEQKIKAQTGVFKTVIKRIGANILSGKGLANIVNFTLPVQVFKNYSNLEKMAKAYIYAPKFIQRATKLTDPVERMKNVICFSLGTTVAYVQSEKPFNPILGQTYQGLIDGCPLYAEQICHHPPVCSVLFLGRGYKIYGSFEPKFEMGLNTATGRNDGCHNIQFQSDNSLVKCYNPAGQMHGLALGERKLYQIKKTPYIDTKNRIYCQITWGKQSSDPYPQAKLYDYFRGRIVKIRPGVNMEDYKNIKKSDIEEQYGDVYGRFTGQIYYKDELIFDTGKDLPFELQDYVPCLESDSRYRKDVIQMRRNDLEAAQNAKEELEEIQRADRKLRKQFESLR